MVEVLLAFNVVVLQRAMVARSHKLPGTHQLSVCDEVQTEQGDRLFLEMTIDVVKKFRTMPERLPPWLGRLGIWE
jgi:hypothetical protein